MSRGDAQGLAWRERAAALCPRIQAILIQLRIAASPSEARIVEIPDRAIETLE